MKALLIGGTGTISTAVSRELAASGLWELFVLNRGNRIDVLPAGTTIIQADAKNEEEMSRKLEGLHFDCVCEFIGMDVSDVERDWRVFRDRCFQYIFISSASAYQKPRENPVVTELTPLVNPFWTYSQKKIACEEFLFRKFAEDGFPVTVVRPSHTYDERKIPVGLHGAAGSWQVLQRMREGKPVVIHDNGEAFWTLTFNSDFAKGFVALMGNKAAVGEAFHITSDESLTWNDIYSIIADSLGVKLKCCHISAEDIVAAQGNYDFRGGLCGDKACSSIFDNSKLKKLCPGFKCNTSFAEGEKKALQHILSHEECRRPDPEFDLWCDNICRNFRVEY